jgi:hypothetical protein
MKKTATIGNISFFIFCYLFFTSCSEAKKPDEGKMYKPKDTITQRDTLFKKYSRNFDDAARFYAGIDQYKGSSFSNLDSNKIWLNYKQSFGAFWENAQKKRFPVLKAFRRSELAGINDSLHTLFYPFSGPDFIHADLFFPKAKKMILIGLERIGDIPDLTKKPDKNLDIFFQAIRVSLDSIFYWGYFITKNMIYDFSKSLDLRGVTPIFLLFMVRQGYIILNVEKGTIDKYGNWVNAIMGIQDSDNPMDTYISGVKIEYVKPGEKQKRSLYYFSHDVSDNNLLRTPEFMKFLGSQEINTTYLKAASYLMGYFNLMRDFAVNHSSFVFQSDCGIPFRYFDKRIWKFDFYGKYTHCIRTFAGCLQPDLKQEFQKPYVVKPLEFGIDYGFHVKESNLMIARRK